MRRPSGKSGLNLRNACRARACFRPCDWQRQPETAFRPASGEQPVNVPKEGAAIGEKAAGLHYSGSPDGRKVRRHEYAWKTMSRGTSQSQLDCDAPWGTPACSPATPEGKLRRRRNWSGQGEVGSATEPLGNRRAANLNSSRAPVGHSPFQAVARDKPVVSLSKPPPADVPMALAIAMSRLYLKRSPTQMTQTANFLPMCIDKQLIRP